MAAVSSVSVSLRLPRDVTGLSLVRAVANQVLTAGAVSADCRYDTTTAVTEACDCVEARALVAALG